MQFPAKVQTIIETLQKAGFAAYAVGGCVRDLLMSRPPKDWDVTTSAKPAEIQKLFPKNFYANEFGTVTVLTGSAASSLREIEVTTYRVDAGYSDQRHPDSIEFTADIKEDLARRDFTINAMAMDETTIIDPFGGQKDMADRLIRAVGKPTERFTEDALRLMRAVRFAAELNFTIEAATLHALTTQAPAIAAVSHERVRDEFTKIVMSDQPEKGLQLLQQTGLLALLFPELAEGVGIEQNKHHIYTVFEHNSKSLQFAANFNYPLHVRLAALLHDIGKPRTRRRQAGDYTFYGHDIVGTRMAENMMKRLRYSNALVKKVTHLIRYHMFYYDIGKITEAGIRRLLRRVGPEHFNDLIKLRMAERKGSGVPKAEPYRLRHLQFMAEKVSQQPLTTSQLAINGHDLIEELKLKPSPIIGGILNALLAEVIDDPKKNKKGHLLKRADQLKDKDPNELKALGAQAVSAEEKKKEEEIRRKYRV